MFIFVVVIVVAVLILVPPLRVRIVEAIKDASDLLVIGFLRGTSRFGAELTEDGEAEQEHWREQRRRNLRGLALRSKARGRNDQPKRERNPD